MVERIPPSGEVGAEAGGVASRSARSNGDAVQATNVHHVGNFKFSNHHIKRVNKHYLALGLIRIKGKVQSFD